MILFLFLDYYFSVPQNVSHVYILKNGGAVITYKITFENSLIGDPIDVIDIGTPNETYVLKSAKAWIDGIELKDIRKSTYVKPGIEVHLGEHEIKPGERGVFEFAVGIKKMVYQGKRKNFASLQFTPTWFGEGFTKGSTDLHIFIHFPEGVKKDEMIWYDLGEEYNRPTEVLFKENRVVYHWHIPNASPSSPYIVGVGFPRRYMRKVYSPPGSTVFGKIGGFLGGLREIILGIFLSLLPFLIIGGIIGFAIWGAIEDRRRRLEYLPPRIGIEGAGPRTDLLPAEVACLFERPLNEVINVVIVELARKGKIRIKNPSPLKIEILDRTGLNYYEDDFIKAVKKDGRLSERRLRDMVVRIVRALNSKMRGYSRRETIDYYRERVDEKWRELKETQDPERTREILEQEPEWLFLEEEYYHNFNTWTPVIHHVYTPSWFSNYSPQVSESPRDSSAMGRRLASTSRVISGNVVRNVNSFTMAVTNITNPPPRASSSSGWSSSSSCACACACAGCACACAGGGR